jgi:hypothetical protein
MHELYLKKLYKGIEWKNCGVLAKKLCLGILRSIKNQIKSNLLFGAMKMQEHCSRNEYSTQDDCE